MQDKKLSRAEIEFQRLLNWNEKDRENLKELLFNLAYDEDELSEELAEISPITVEDITQVKQDMKTFGQIEGLGTMIEPIDKMTAGFAPGELIVVLGQSSQGKSLCTANLAAQQAMAGHKVIFVTLETDARNLKKRLWYIMGEEQFAWVAKHETFYIQTHDRIPYTSIRYLVEKAKKNYGAEIVYIDHLHYFSRDMQDQANGLGAITQEFKIIALENEIPIVLVSHVRKMQERSARPDLDDARGSSFIGQDADVVLSVRQDPDTYSEEHILVGLLKNRNRCIWKVGSEVCLLRDGVRIIAPRKCTESEELEWNITRKWRQR